MRSECTALGNRLGTKMLLRLAPAPERCLVDWPLALSRTRKTLSAIPGAEGGGRDECASQARVKRMLQAVLWGSRGALAYGSTLNAQWCVPLVSLRIMPSCTSLATRLNIRCLWLTQSSLSLALALACLCCSGSRCCDVLSRGDAPTLVSPNTNPLLSPLETTPQHRRAAFCQGTPRSSTGEPDPQKPTFRQNEAAGQKTWKDAEGEPAQSE
mmetsp:Transcript_32289/g.81326  ORF Transcript_32289/g.81326 Transcript_32289/m.81326 type:complete len:212 (+) Transcript_32289:392-1027(+)